MNNLVRRRLANQRLSRSGFDTPSDVVAWLGAMQSQDYAGAKWAIGLRASVTDADVEQACDEGSLIRTHILRQTWHFVARRDDIRWMLALSGPRVNTVNAHYYRKLNLDERTLSRSRAVIERALRDGQHLTRPELKHALARARIVAQGPRLAFLIMRAELDASICSGPRRGNQLTYVLLDERVPPAKSISRDAALSDLARRYFASHGPATLDGRLAGSWTRTVSAQSVVVGCSTYARPTEATRRAIDTAVARLGRFMGLPATLSLADRK